MQAVQPILELISSSAGESSVPHITEDKLEL